MENGQYKFYQSFEKYQPFFSQIHTSLSSKSYLRKSEFVVEDFVSGPDADLKAIMHYLNIEKKDILFADFGYQVFR